jgi:hypothetical protein
VGRTGVLNLGTEEEGAGWGLTALNSKSGAGEGVPRAPAARPGLPRLQAELAQPAAKPEVQTHQFFVK